MAPSVVVLVVAIVQKYPPSVVYIVQIAALTYTAAVRNTMIKEFNFLRNELERTDDDDDVKSHVRLLFVFSPLQCIADASSS